MYIRTSVTYECAVELLSYRFIVGGGAKNPCQARELRYTSMSTSNVISKEYVERCKWDLLSVGYVGKD